ncbi:hypothetical protein [Pseudomonas viridiflava]|nr:hypothetical protein [Pseudomonas viridiflava]
MQSDQQDETLEQRAMRLLQGQNSQRVVAKETGLSRRQVGHIADRLKTLDDDPFGVRPQPKSALKDETFREIHAMACRPEGVKRSELSSLLAMRFGFCLDEKTGKHTLDMTRNQYDYLKSQIKDTQSQGYAPLFIPEWMPRTNPVDAWKLLMQSANELLTRIDEQVTEFCQEFPEVLPKNVRRELLSIAIDEFSPQPTIVSCEWNSSVAQELSMRVPPCVPAVHKEQSKELAEFEAICL